jgi:hypothetical protein
VVVPVTLQLLVADGSCPQSSGEASEVGFCQGVGVDAADAEQVDDVLVPQRRQGEPHGGTAKQAGCAGAPVAA